MAMIVLYIGILDSSIYDVDMLKKSYKISEWLSKLIKV